MTDNKNYRILPLGEFCLPRFITVQCGLKPRRAEGEKSCPFDLAFFLDFNCILNFLDTEFRGFFDGIEHDYIHNIKLKTDLFRYFRKKLYWPFYKHDEGCAYFIHEGDWLDREGFVDRYQKRIDNLYEYLNDKERKLYNLISTFEPITQTQINRLNSIIERYRPKGSFSNIIINLSDGELDINSYNTFVLNYTKQEYRDIFKIPNWLKAIREHDSDIIIDEFYKRLTGELAQIIR